MVKEFKVGDEEVESLMDEVQDHGKGKGEHKSNKTIIVKETTHSSSTVLKVLTVILVGLVTLFATDSIELKNANQGALKQGAVLDKVIVPDGNGENIIVTKKPTTAEKKGTVGVHEKTKEEVQEKRNGPAVVVQEKKKKGPELPMVYENETPRHSYKNRGQPMPEALAKEQTSKWGEWKPMTKERPQHDFYKDHPSRDVPRAKFPSNAWQLNKDYMEQFLTQGKDLVMRAMEAILSEYGHGVDDEPGATFANRSAMFHLRRYNLTTPKITAIEDGGWTSNRSWEGLKRRLLHAIMTEDSFNFAMAGHSASAGHG
jgi:hypothetical protein